MFNFSIPNSIFPVTNFLLIKFSGLFVIIPIISRIQKNIKTVLSIYSLISYTTAEETISKLYIYLEEAAQDSSEKIKSRSLFKKNDYENNHGLGQNFEDEIKGDTNLIEIKEETKEEL